MTMRTTVHSRWFGALMLVASVTGSGVAQDAERIVPVHQEPRHRMVFEAEGTRILHLQIHPGDTSLWHTHSEPILYVSFGATTQTRTQNHGGAWGAPVSVFPSAPPSRVLSSTAYAQKPLTHRIENVGQNLFELIAVLNLTSGDERRTPQEAGFDTTPELTNGWYRTYRVTVFPDRPVRHTHAAPVVLVQTSLGTASGSGTRIFGFNSPASWAYFDADEGHELRAVGPTATEFVEVEVRQPKVQ
jgi:hypothetical protein